MKTILALAIVLATTSIAQAQPFPSCSPYNNDPCMRDVSGFANVPVNVPGLEVANVAIGNRGTTSRVQIIVSYLWPGYTIPIVGMKEVTYAPFERRDNFLTDPALWPELQGYQGGVSVVIRTDGMIDASIALHPAYDAANPKAFWQGMKVLEGR